MTSARSLTPVLFFVLFLCSCCLNGCAKQTTVVLLPDPGGKVGKVTVTSDVASIDITKAQEATVIKGRQSAPTAPKVLSEAEIARNFSEALSSLPEPPKHFNLYFEKDSDRLTAQSQQVIPDILAAASQRQSQDIGIIGHTDTAGDPSYNMRLSKQRANAVLQILIQEGIQDKFVKITSHGENNPLIKTADNVHEPKNRRVEVVVR
ncbi:OmpA family protein [Desulforhopalus sp. IMCC35007]|uniref:OmpA family protein n=1 Tax=Desulforhopalus sp. IMCC35007 TaxID=2569543 RepID=UPI0010AEB0E1|nr:OmpA family protein [Desulforhopalus sp. IMCC35007]TKB11858.1 OmpA family protein [Desulforhopalus sp. IMCC35007]